MIRAVAAIDSKRGLADKSGIPWKLPQEHRHFRELTKDHDVLMGYSTYLEFIRPLRHRRNYVICQPQSILRDGFYPVYDVDAFLKAHTDLWVIGGAKTFALALPYCQELHITQLDQDFGCTKFFPEIPASFKLIKESEPLTENNITYTYQTWHRKSTP